MQPDDQLVVDSFTHGTQSGIAIKVEEHRDGLFLCLKTTAPKSPPYSKDVVVIRESAILSLFRYQKET